MDLIGFIFVCLAVILISKLIGSMKSSSPEERYLKTFGVPFNARSEDTEKAFAGVFIREKQPYAVFFRQLLSYDGRELTKEEKEQRGKLQKEMTKVLKHLKEILDLASLYKPKEAKKVAEDLHIDQLIAPLVKPKVVVSSING